VKAELGDINMNSPEVRKFILRQLSSEFQAMHFWLGKIKLKL